ncbi:hemin-binding periplasmic protein [Parvularcula bermudensis HTCC2503]|uniref:Hemin-binding periplasmic protein n=1 Tax=Parvularcula bermudensis (strain ATCC BAA-594 / HTCC2503 / KCTC 12087) TaxID=314260 RepID=E0THW7_PARBH|nr:ABC transporter substrate-binding protein [Parvularcula bermudensis]ADM10778.1 hemin-binding periplasmic protein [Parvularcula bermudensis HTCC2503]
MRRLLTILSVAAAFVGTASAQDRIVSLGGDLTEIIYALGEGDRVVGTDRDSRYPDDAAAKPKVGYVRRLSAEGVLSVEPDLVLISGAAGPETALAQIEASGVEIISLETEYTPQAILDKVGVVATALGREDAGETMKADLEKTIAAARRDVERVGISPSILFFASVPDGAPRAAGDETAAAGVIDMLGGTNVFAGRPGYNALSLEAAVAADPDIILVMTHHAEREGGIEAVRTHPALLLTTAAQEGRVFLVDQYSVMQFGPRTPQSVAELAEKIADALGE